MPKSGPAVTPAKEMESVKMDPSFSTRKIRPKFRAPSNTTNHFITVLACASVLLGNRSRKKSSYTAPAAEFNTDDRVLRAAENIPAMKSPGSPG